MAGGKSTPKKDKALKVSNGQTVKIGQILLNRLNTYKAGLNVKGLDILFALCPGKIYFTRKKTSHGKVRTFINIAAAPEKSPK